MLVDLSAGLSTKTYKAADVKVRWLQALGDRVEIWTSYRYEDFPQEDYFGRGLTSVRDQRTSYDFDSNEVRALGLFKPATWLRLGTEIGYMAPDIGAGSDSNFPSIEQLFSDVEAPGLLEQPRYLHTTVFADVDYRDERNRQRRNLREQLRKHDSVEHGRLANGVGEHANVFAPNGRFAQREKGRMGDRVDQPSPVEAQSVLERPTRHDGSKG